MSYIKETSTRYDQIARNYASDWRGEFTKELRIQADYFLNYLPLSANYILDAGTGTGKVADYFCNRGYEVIGLDLSLGMLAQFQRSVTYVNKGGVPVQADMRFLPLQRESVDGIWCMASLVHIPRQDKPLVINEFFRVLKKSGILFISVQNKLSPKHLKRIVESSFYHLGYDEHNRVYKKFKPPGSLITDGLKLPQRLKEGYAFLDKRYWFFPSKSELVALLNTAGFNIIDTNSLFSKRITILAYKPR